MENFRKLGIIEPILQVIEEEGFDKPSEIQEKSIPVILEGKDVIAGSATGSGKTLAFGAGILANCERQNVVQALVLVPTRELAEQVKDSLKKFSKYKKLKTCVVYGGVSINPQIENLKRSDVVVGTPGRLLDHLERGTIDLSHVKMVVLDEADRMLDMGFIDDVARIISACPRKRQTLLYSATITQEIEHISKRFLTNPVKVSVSNQIDPSLLKQVYYDVSSKMKFSLLVHLMKQENPGLVMVFCNSRENVDFVARNLEANGIPASAIHGGFSQDKRNKVLKSFHNKKVSALVCTDVAARGLDIPSVSHVFNYDIPKDPKQYIHRIGRTARAGKEGIAINILAPRDHDNYSRLLADQPVEVHKVETPQDIKRVNIIVNKNSGRGNSGFNRNGRNQGRGGHRDGSRGSFGGSRRSSNRGGQRNDESRGSSGSRSGSRRFGNNSVGNRSSGRSSSSFGNRGQGGRGNSSRSNGGNRR